jgi:hypothetical protein
MMETSHISILYIQWLPQILQVQNILRTKWAAQNGNTEIYFADILTNLCQNYMMIIFLHRNSSKIAERNDYETAQFNIWSLFTVSDNFARDGSDHRSNLALEPVNIATTVAGCR